MRLIRKTGYIRSLVKARVWVDQQELERMAVTDVLDYPLEEGVHQLKVRLDWSKPVVMDVEDNDVVEIRTSLWGLIFPLIAAINLFIGIIWPNAASKIILFVCLALTLVFTKFSPTVQLIKVDEIYKKVN